MVLASLLCPLLDCGVAEKDCGANAPSLILHHHLSLLLLSILLVFIIMSSLLNIFHNYGNVPLSVSSH
jgi:hypothetical protein